MSFPGVDVAATLTSVAVMLLTVRATGRDGLRRQRAAAAADRRRQAAAQLRQDLLALQDLVWQGYAGDPPSSAAVSEAMKVFQRHVRAVESLLPRGATHLAMSARQAVGNVYGAPALSALVAAAAHQPLSQVEPHWADVSLTWFEEAAARLHQWEDDPRSARLNLVRYDQWRRDEDEMHTRSASAPSGVMEEPADSERRAGERSDAVPGGGPDAPAATCSFRSAYLVVDARDPSTVLGVVRRDQKLWSVYRLDGARDQQPTLAYASRQAAAASLLGDSGPAPTVGR